MHRGDRFKGRWKDFGPQYNRGIEEGNGLPPDGALWDAYSVNKEDIWIARVPVPVRIHVDSNVNDSFDSMDTGGVVTDWNIYSPKWAPVSVVEFPGVSNKSLELQNSEPYDYSRAVRVFPESRKLSLSLKVFPHQSDNGRLEIDVLNHSGKRPIQLSLDNTGALSVLDGDTLRALMTYTAHKWVNINLEIDVSAMNFSVSCNGGKVVSGLKFACKVSG